MHGAPVHIGKPELIGIEDITQPWVGDFVGVHDDELPVFWACGVTPQSAVAQARPPLCITHAPGHMLVTDRTNSELMEGVRPEGVRPLWISLTAISRVDPRVADLSTGV